MNDALKSKIDLMIENHKELKRLIWANSYERYFMAMYFAQKSLAPDVERIKQINRYIKENTGVFSAFRAEAMYFISALVSAESDYFTLFQKMQDVYARLRDARFHSSSYLTVAAYVIAMSRNEEDTDRAVCDMRQFFDELKAAHPLITSYDDYAFAAVLAVSGKDLNIAAVRMESIYRKLDDALNMFGQRNTLQAVSSVLVLSDEDEDALAEKYVGAVKLARDHKIHLGFGGYSSLASICVFRKNISDDIANIAEYEKYLRTVRHFGNFSLNRELRFSLIAGLLLAEQTGVEPAALAGSATNMIGLIMAQQAAVIAASSAAAASASSSAH
jgi:hypothetical protein